MTSIIQQSSSLGSCPTFPSPKPHYNRPSGHWPCVKSCLVGGRDKYTYSGPVPDCQCSMTGLRPRDKYTHSSSESRWARKVIRTSSSQGTPTKALSTSSSCQRHTAPGLPNSRCFDSNQQTMQELASNPTQPAKPTTAAFLIQTAFLRANLRNSYNQRALLLAKLRKSLRPILVFSLHLPGSNFTSGSSCTFQLPVPADQLWLHQQQFHHLQATSTSRPAPVSPSSESCTNKQQYQQQTSSSFTQQRTSASP